MLVTRDFMFRYSEIKLKDLLKLMSTYELKTRYESLFRMKKGDYVDATPSLLMSLEKDYSFIVRKAINKRSKILDVLIIEKDRKFEVSTTMDYMFICLLRDSYCLKAWRSFNAIAYKNYKKYNREVK